MVQTTKKNALIGAILAKGYPRYKLSVKTDRIVVKVSWKQLITFRFDKEGTLASDSEPTLLLYMLIGPRSGNMFMDDDLETEIFVDIYKKLDSMTPDREPEYLQPFVNRYGIRLMP